MILLKNPIFFLLQKVFYESKKTLFNKKEKTAPLLRAEMPVDIRPHTPHLQYFNEH